MPAKLRSVVAMAFGQKDTDAIFSALRSAPPNRAVRVVGALLLAHTVFAQFWPPMHP